MGEQISELEQCLNKTSWIYCEGHEASVNYPHINDIQALSALVDLLKMDLKHLRVEDAQLDRMFKEVEIMSRSLILDCSLAVVEPSL